MITMGVDCGTRKVSYALLKDGDLLHAETYESPESEPRAFQLASLANWLRWKIGAIEPDWVWIESIIVGNNRKYSIKLAEVYGAVLSRLSEPELGIGSVDNKQWKRDVCGNGNANKDLITKWLAEEHPEWNLNDQDQRDAACIALYGQQIVEKADGLKLE